MNPNTPEVHARGAYGCWIMEIVRTESDGVRIIVDPVRPCDLPGHHGILGDAARSSTKNDIANARPEG